MFDPMLFLRQQGAAPVGNPTTPPGARGMLAGAIPPPQGQPGSPPPMGPQGMNFAGAAAGPMAALPAPGGGGGGGIDAKQALQIFQMLMGGG